jgi:hypothetical protein
MKHSAGDDRSRPSPPRPRKPNSPFPKKAARAIDRVVRVREKVFLANAMCARAAWGVLPNIALHALRELAEKYALSVAGGNLLYLDGRWYVTHAGLLRLANRHRCASIQVQPLAKFCEPTSNRWVFRATVYKTPRSNGFVGYGDADPSNVSLLVRGAELRVAETRAVNRALRKAYGIGICSIEESGAPPLVTADQFQPAISPVGLFSLSSIELGLPCGRSHAVPLVSAFGSAPSRPSVPGERRGDFSAFSSPFACPNLTPSPGTKARNQLTLLSA